ncbi:YdcF family protein [Alcanivorax sp. JB21]|uniref:YdcF family protein n=1 Tax=Alcanivorax limicola TaxID=2874102 RepID=UPI001CBAA6DA|nr:YdcF family protein [Alcanivorax limicola]MBZ2188647.1 YdcF family protein [Alcanivorax limicola]
MGSMTLFALLFVLATLPGVVRRFMPPMPRAGFEGNPQAVVTLGAGHTERGGRYQVSPAGLRRVDVAMHVADEMQLPLLISGGGRRGEGVPAEAVVMAEALKARWPDSDPWLETESRNTWENAEKSAQILAQRGVQRIVLVTDRTHLCRATLCFQNHGLEVVPLSASRMPSPEWMPSAGALSVIPEIYYEWVALIWYHLRYLR